MKSLKERKDKTTLELLDAILLYDLSGEAVEALAILLTALTKAESDSVRDDICWEATNYLFRETGMYHKSFDQFSQSLESRSRHLTSDIC